jgi:phage shock protein A
VFDFKQEQNFRVSTKLEEMVDKAREKLEASGSGFIKELDKREAKLNDELNRYKIQVEKSCDEHKSSVDSDVARMESDIEKLNEKVSGLQQWIWTAVGGGTVFVFVVEVITNGGLKLLGL